MNVKTFAPNGDDTVLLAATAASSRAAINQFSSVVRVLNAGPDLVYLHFGDSTVTANNAKMPLPVGAAELFTKAAATHVAAVCDATKTASVYFTSGEGL